MVLRVCRRKSGAAAREGVWPRPGRGAAERVMPPARLQPPLVLRLEAGGGGPGIWLPVPASAEAGTEGRLASSSRFFLRVTGTRN